MKEKNKHILKKAIADLPDYKFPQDNRCELFFRNKLLVDQLKDFRAPEKIWPIIESVLIAETKPVRKLQILKGVAAAAIILAVFSTIYILAPSKQSLFKKEMARGYALPDFSIEKNDLLFQSSNLLVRSNPQFIQLKNQLLQVNSEIQKFQDLVRSDDPRMMKYYYRLKNTQIEIEKKMLKMILET